MSIDFQPLHADKGSPCCQGRRGDISSNIGMQFKARGEWRHGNEYSTQTPKKSTLFSGQNLYNRSNFDISVLGYIGIVWPKEHSPKVWSFLLLYPVNKAHIFPRWLVQTLWLENTFLYLKTRLNIKKKFPNCLYFYWNLGKLLHFYVINPNDKNNLSFSRTQHSSKRKLSPWILCFRCW